MSIYDAKLIILPGNPRRVRLSAQDKVKLKLKEDPIVPQTAIKFDLNKCVNDMPIKVKFENGFVISVESTTLSNNILNSNITINNEPPKSNSNDSNHKFANSKNSDYRPNKSPHNTTTPVGEAPKLLKQSFINPYTFIPFPEKVNTANLVPNTIGESKEETRYSGVIQIKLKNESPLLSHHSEPLTNSAHIKYKALMVGKDFIVPATAVKGFLRYLSTIISASSISHLDHHGYLCQKRDLQFHNGKQTVAGTKIGELVKIVEVGSANSSGKVQLGTTRFEFRDKVSSYKFVNLANGKINNTTEEDPHAYQVKLSGKPIKSKGKKEGLFKKHENSFEVVPAKVWAIYNYMHRHTETPELKKGQLVWVERNENNKIATFQAARWGRKGESILKLIPVDSWPDWVRKDSKYSPVTALFGVADFDNAVDKGETAKILPKFASRLKFGNLIFKNAKLTKMVPLTPLSSPHPGCVAFYRQYTEGKVDEISNKKPLRGLKAYRNVNTKEKPWEYNTQPIYDKSGKPDQKNKEGKVNISVELLEENQNGALNISFLNLSLPELGLLKKCCELPWRLGGGKPLGLGLLKIENLRFINEDGNEISLDLLKSEALIDEKQVLYWLESQKQFNNVRYPTAFETKNNDKTGGGHIWFSKFSNPKANHSPGFTSIDIRSGIENKKNVFIAGQALPLLTSEDQNLYGYKIDVKKIDVKKIEGVEIKKAQYDIINEPNNKKGEKF